MSLLWTATEWPPAPAVPQAIRRGIRETFLGPEHFILPIFVHEEGESAFCCSRCRPQQQDS